MLATVATFIDPTDAHILRARLEAEGIPACVVNEHHVRLNWFQAMALGGARVQVAAENVEEVLATGIRAVAVTAAVMGAADVRGAARGLKERLLREHA